MFDYRFWKFILDSLRKFEVVGVAFIVDHKGSSPGKTGFRLAVNNDLESYGTIGGALMEQKLIQTFELMLDTAIDDVNVHSDEKIQFELRRQIHNRKAEEKDRSGLICSGQQTIIYGILRKYELEVVQRILNTFFDNFLHTLVITPNSFSFVESNIRPDFSTKQIEFSDRENWSFSMMTSLHHHIYVFGAGHVGKAIMWVFDNLNFVVHLLDFRKEMFKDLPQKKWLFYEIINDYSAIKTVIHENQFTYITIVNTNIIHDIESLKIVLRKKVKYIGLMGTTAKRLEIFRQLKEEGFTEADFKQIHSPIGIPIKSQSGEEIAISVASEIIKLKNE